MPVLQTIVDNVGSDTIFADETSLEYAPIVPNPGKIICVGLNYRRHALESGMDVPTTPILFSKFNNSIASSGEVVPLPARSK